MKQNINLSLKSLKTNCLKYSKVPNIEYCNPIKI